MNSGPIDGKKKSDSLGTETFDNIKFSTVICYDAAQQRKRPIWARSSSWIRPTIGGKFDTITLQS